MKLVIGGVAQGKLDYVLSESPEVISFTSRASLSSTERTTENIWDVPFILGR